MKTKITKELVPSTCRSLIKKNGEFIEELFESLSIEEVNDLFTYYNTNSSISIGELETSDILIKKELLCIKADDMLEWFPPDKQDVTPNIYGDGWHLTELGQNVMSVLLDVYDRPYLENKINNDEFLNEHSTSVFQNHSSISLYVKSDIFNGYTQINRETRKIIQTEIPAAHYTKDLPKLIKRLKKLNELLDKLQNKLDSVDDFKPFIEIYKDIIN